MSTLPRLIDDYISDRQARGRFGAQTGKTVRYTLLSLQPFLPPDIRRVRTCDVEEWLAKKRMAPSTARAQLSHARGFFRWLVRRGHLGADPTIDVEGPRIPRCVPRGLRHDAVEAALDAGPDARAKLVMLLMTQEGLRCIEVASLELGDIDGEERIMLVRGKGGHQRVLPLSDETWTGVSRLPPPDEKSE